MPAALSEFAEPTQQERQKALEAARALAEGHLEVAQLPDMARLLLSRILTELASGHALSVVSLEADLTTSQAAKYLNVSRPYVSRLLREGKLPCYSVGTHKRIRLRDIKTYRERQDAESYVALAELQAQAQELNMGY